MDTKTNIGKTGRNPKLETKQSFSNFKKKKKQNKKK